MPRKPNTNAPALTAREIEKKARCSPADLPAMLQNRTPQMRALLEAAPLEEREKPVKRSKIASHGAAS